MPVIDKPDHSSLRVIFYPLDGILDPSWIRICNIQRMEGEGKLKEIVLSKLFVYATNV